MKTIQGMLKALLWLILGCSLVAHAQQGVPYAIKYQAVLHDVEGNTLVNRSGISLRITLRQGAIGGNILYQEYHRDVRTNMFGMVHLEIGRGETDQELKSVDWGNTPIYAQIEVEMDKNGYTQMGASELLSVPYAFYAGNSGGSDFGLLQHQVLPKYDINLKTLVNSGVFQNDDSLTIRSKKVIFEGNSSYVFPSGRGLKGQVLSLKDENGNMGWSDGGGGGGGGADPRLDLLGQDGYMVYWEDEISRVKTSSLQYDYLGKGGLTAHAPLKWLKGAQGYGKNCIYDTLEVDGLINLKGNATSGNKIAMEALDLVIDAQVSGNNNLMLNRLSPGAFWMGNPATGRAKEIYLKGNIKRVVDSIYIDAPQYGLSLGEKDTVSLDSNGLRLYRPDASFCLTSYEGVWKADPHKHVIFNNGDTALFDVGIGTSYPQARLHVKGGPFLVSDLPGEDKEWPIKGKGNYLAFGGRKSAFRVGAITDDSWDEARVGAYSIGLGYNVKAEGPHSLAIGRQSLAKEENNIAIGYSVEAKGAENMVIGKNSILESSESFAIGFENTISSVAHKSFAVGSGNYVTGTDGFTMGQKVNNDGHNSVALGYALTVNGEKSIGIGIGDNPSERQDVMVTGNQSIAMGHNATTVGNSSVVIGDDVSSSQESGGSNIPNGSIVLGTKSHNKGEYSLVMGSGLNNGSSYGVLIGGDGNNSGTGTLAGSDLSISVGMGNAVSGSAQSVCIGAGLTTTDMESAINIGFMNAMSSASLGEGGVAIGCNLTTLGREVLLGAYGSNVRKSADPVLVIASGNQTTLANAMEVDRNGDMYVYRNIHAGGTITPSDVNLKADIKPLREELSVLEQLQPVSFVFKTDAEHHLHFGFIAQEVEKYFPHLVFRNKKGELSLNYTEMIPVLWQYTQTLYQKVQNQDEKIRSQQEKIELLEGEMNKIKTKLGL